jgi:nitroreductase
MGNGRGTPQARVSNSAQEFDRVLASRRMCRDFTAQEIESGLLNKVLLAAFRGPSAGNTAAIELLVLSQPQVAQYWSLTLTEEKRESFPWPGLLNAPTLVIPLVRPSAYQERYQERDKAHTGLGDSLEAWQVPYWYVDGGAGLMGLLLAAEAAGLGALFFGQFQHEHAVTTAFGVPEDYRALGTVALGWPNMGGRKPSVSAARGRVDPELLIHHQSW